MRPILSTLVFRLTGLVAAAASLFPKLALLTGGVLLLVPATTALADSLSVNFGPGPGVSCDSALGCSGSTSGSLSGQSGTYTFQFDVGNPNFTDTQECFTPQSSANQATIDFANSNSLVLALGQVCLPTDLTVESGTASMPFSILSGTNDYACATGSGTVNVNFDGSILFGSNLTVLSLSSSNFSAPAPPCGTNGGNGGNGGGGNPGQTPELDSLALFGAGLISAAGYLKLRRRARKA